MKENLEQVEQMEVPLNNEEGHEDSTAEDAHNEAVPLQEPEGEEVLILNEDAPLSLNTSVTDDMETEEVTETGIIQMPDNQIGGWHFLCFYIIHSSLS